MLVKEAARNFNQWQRVVSLGSLVINIGAEKDDFPHGKTIGQIFEKLPESLPEEKSGEVMSKEKMRARLKTEEGGSFKSHDKILL